MTYGSTPFADEASHGLIINWSIGATPPRQFRAGHVEGAPPLAANLCRYCPDSITPVLLAFKAS